MGYNVTNNSPVAPVSQKVIPIAALVHSATNDIKLQQSIRESERRNQRQTVIPATGLSFIKLRNASGRHKLQPFPLSAIRGCGPIIALTEKLKCIAIFRRFAMTTGYVAEYQFPLLGLD
ncbi:hypothetical protein ACTXT7_009817 [Hymenolepis weldensis]